MYKRQHKNIIDTHKRVFLLLRNVLVFFIWSVSYTHLQLIPLDVMEESKKEAKDLWENGYPKKWYYGIPVVFIWIFIIFMIIKQFI